MGDLLNNLITFGAHGRVQRKIQEFENIEQELRRQIDYLTQANEEVNKKFDTLIETKKKAIKSLQKIKRISKHLKGKERDVSIQYYETIPASEISGFHVAERTISLAETALNASKGVGAGLSTAFGAWALVSSYGVASTGTAIASLSGIAASNATLAWLGGGSIAAGGGGIAAGTTVLGGLLAIPALAIAGISNHISANKKIKEIGEKINEVVEKIDHCKKLILAAEVAGRRSDEVKSSIDKANEAFLASYRYTIKKIYPIPLFSRLIKWVRKFFGYNYFNAKDVQEIASIGKIAGDFAKLIDTKIIDSNETII